MTDNLTDTDNRSDNDFVIRKVKTANPSVTLQDTIKQLPWSEKYRPQKTENIILDSLIKKKIQKMLEKNSIENMIICGASGQGKTTLAKCLTRACQKTVENYKNGVLELNASNDRGIRAVKENIRPFCSKKFISTEKGVEKKVAIEKHIIFDEADNMTEKEQQQIAKVMDEYKSKVKFIFTCNQTTNIIPSIQTRCLIFRLNRPSEEQIIKHLVKILKKENCEYTFDALVKVVQCSEGDIRYAINLVHVVSVGFGKVTEKNIRKIVIEPPAEELEKIILYCQSGKLIKAVKKLNKLRREGYSQIDIINIFLRETAHHPFKNEIDRIHMLTIISKWYISLKKSVNTELQLNACVAECCLVLNPENKKDD